MIGSKSLSLPHKLQCQKKETKKKLKSLFIALMCFPPSNDKSINYL